MKQVFPIAPAAILSACVATVPSAEEAPSAIAANGKCDISGVQNLIGEEAHPGLTDPLLEATGARDLRWIPPRSAVTMDYREDRVNVTYDDSFIILRIYCG